MNIYTVQKVLNEEFRVKLFDIHKLVSFVASNKRTKAIYVTINLFSARTIILGRSTTRSPVGFEASSRRLFSSICGNAHLGHLIEINIVDCIVILSLSSSILLPVVNTYIVTTNVLACCSSTNP